MSGADRAGAEAERDGAKQRRLAEALRENLKRRKAQVRRRKVSDEPPGRTSPDGEERR